MQPYRNIAIGISCAGLLGGLAACSTQPTPLSGGHLRDTDVVSTSSNIPAPVQASVAVPRPRTTAKTETYSVVVNNIKVQELLFALARDAKLNVDIHPGISGTVTLNAIDQTLQQLLQRIAKQVDIRWELDGANLAVMPDTPFLRSYKVDYVNLSRDSSGTISANSQINTGGASGSTGSSGSSPGSSGNISTTKVENKISNHFWESLEKNIKDLLRETDKLLPDGSSETIIERSDQQNTTGTGAQYSNRSTRNTTQQAGLSNSPNPATLQQDETTVLRRSNFREAASVIVNAETGVINVRATGRQHEKIQEFIDLVSASARRQVMIEVTVVEVKLNDEYRQGINWSKLSTAVPFTGVTSANTFTLTASVNKTVSLLEQFGDVRVLSSPKLSVLNNQSALLKVVENQVYFLVKSDVASSTVAGVAPIKAFTTTPQSVSVGLVMSVTPQISENNSITLNVRPSISSISSFVTDPNPDLKTANISNDVPVIRTREIESIMRVEDGEIAVLGGLMEDSINYNNNRIPLVGAIPFLGEIFSARNNTSTKSELVIFLRPVVIRDPSLSGDYKNYRKYLPDNQTMQRPASSEPFSLPKDRELRP